MVKAFIEGLMSLLINFANIFTSPISNMINDYVPELGDFVTAIANMLNYVIGAIGFFLNLIPPITKLLIFSIIGFYISIYPLRIALQSITRGLNLIKRINIFSGK